MANLVSTLLVGAALVGADLASAQSIGPPTGDTGGVFGRRPTRDAAVFGQDLTLVINGGSGFDDNSDGDGNPLPLGAFGALQSGVLSRVDATATYRVGKTRKSLQTEVRGYSNFASEGIDRISGVAAHIQAELPLGRRAGLFLTGDSSYDPAYLFNAFGPVLDQIEAGGVPGAAPAQGITTEQWLTANGTVGVYRNWSPRQRSETTASTSRRSQRGARGDSSPSDGLSNRANWVGARHSWAPRAYATFDLGYRYENNRTQDLLGLSDSIETQATEVVVRLEKRLSPSRHAQLNLGGGVTHARVASAMAGQAADFTVPSFTALARLQPSRGFEIALDARRDVSVLRGVAPDAFATNAVSLRLSGAPLARLQWAVSGGMSRGTSSLDSAVSFAVATAVAQAQVALTRYCALSMSYAYYDHRLEGISLLIPGFPPGFARSSARVGLTLWIPVVGRF